MKLLSRFCLRSYKTSIGLEIHAQIKSNNKLFSGATVPPYQGCTPNSHVSLFDIATPGTMPMISGRCVEAALSISLALQTNINKKSNFDRKQYFYSDLPQGFQITQKRVPFATNGSVEYYPYTLTSEMTPLHGHITSVVLEQDTAKTVQGNDLSAKLIDMNRCGVGLLEIVTDPSFTSSEHVCGFLLEIMSIMVSSDVNQGRLEEGEVRVDVNVSVDREGPHGKRVEIKNLNSLLSIKRAIEYEEKRQRQLLDNGQELLSETRAYEDINRRTVPLRLKDDGYDYRFVPETNLPPLQISESDVSSNSVPPSNQTIRSYLTTSAELTIMQSAELTRNPYMSSFFMKIFTCFDIPGPHLFHILFKSGSFDVSSLPRDFTAVERLALFVGPLSVFLHNEIITRNVFIMACKESGSFSGSTPEEAVRFVDRLIDAKNWRALKEEAIETALTEALEHIKSTQPSIQALEKKNKAAVNQLVNEILKQLDYRITGKRVSQFVGKIIK